MTDLKNWTIDTSALAAYKTDGWTVDEFWETLDGKYGVYVYNIDEWRMGAYAGLIAIFDNKNSSVPLINSSKTWIWVDNKHTFYYAPLSDCLIFRKPSCQGVQKKGFPFLLIKPLEQSFAFIDWDATSIYYGFDEIGENLLKVNEVHPKDLENLGASKRTAQIIDLNEINWFYIDDFYKALDKYC